MASSLLHALAPTSSFPRVERFIEFPVRNAKQRQFRCAQGDDWEGSVRVTDARRQSLRKDALSTIPKSNPNLVENSSKQGAKSDSLIEDENSGSKVTGKSRGEIFLERAMGTQESNATARSQVFPEVTRNVRKERKQKREKLATFVARRDEPCCYGCGAVLQSAAVEAPGFLPLATFEVKKKHHQLKTVLCGRCVLLSQGAMIPAVTSAFLKRGNVPLCCSRRALSIASSLLNDENEDVDLAWDPYLGEVTANEKVEKPPQYVPPPPIPAEDISIRDKVEFLLYTFNRILPGQLDNDKADVFCSVLSATVEVQNPAVCFRGNSKCSEWLKALIQLQASVNLHELYYENDLKDSEKRWVYAVWTMRFLENAHTSPNDVIDNSSAPESTEMSGETVFEMEKSGLVSRISSTWYILQEDDGASFTKAKDSLWRVLGEIF